MHGFKEFLLENLKQRDVYSQLAHNILAKMEIFKRGVDLQYKGIEDYSKGIVYTTDRNIPAKMQNSAFVEEMAKCVKSHELVNNVMDLVDKRSIRNIVDRKCAAIKSIIKQAYEDDIELQVRSDYLTYRCTFKCKNKNNRVVVSIIFTPERQADMYTIDFLVKINIKMFGLIK